MATTCESDPSASQNRPQPVKISPKTYAYDLLENVHLALPPPVDSPGETIYTSGTFKYFHYECDGTSDAGWGCGYRTLQSAISWIINKRSESESGSGSADGSDAEPTQYVPSIDEIQRLLVQSEDKPSSFIGSRDWIGTLEEFYVIDAIFKLKCRIVHVEQLNSALMIAQFRQYFEDYRGFIAMGGFTDVASKAIVGIHLGEKFTDVYLLVVDPHFSGVPSSKQQLIDKGYVRWVRFDQFEITGYNLCFILQK